MAYSELIKNFERIRDYMRQFYIYGFKHRDQYDAKSTRSYDNERRRMESWLKDYMSFRQDENGKRVFLSVDSRTVSHNPLHQAFKAKGFTSGDILFHFYVLELLAEGDSFSAKEITDLISEKYLSHFDVRPLDESTVRKKLKEYVILGLLEAEKQGRELFYSRSRDCVDLASWQDALNFYSETDPLGVVGSYLLDKLEDSPSPFRFKHHYILHALDSQILYTLLQAIGEKRSALLAVKSIQNHTTEKQHTVFPLKIYISVQNGRQYLLAYHYKFRKPIFFRMDSIREVTLGETESNPQKYSGWQKKSHENLWGVSTGVEHSIDHIEMTLFVGENEPHILNRLEREKRGGEVRVIDQSTCLFSADVYDASELLPWIRTFTGRILKLECSNPTVVGRFYNDFEAVMAMYGGEQDALS